jgi:hypothetical protein
MPSKLSFGGMERRKVGDLRFEDEDCSESCREHQETIPEGNWLPSKVWEGWKWCRFS